MEERSNAIFNRKSILRGVILFFILTLAGLATSFLWKGSKNFINILKSADWHLLIVVLFLIFINWIVKGYWLFIFAEKMSNQVSFWDCFRANLAGTCVASITPVMAGLAGELYILYRAGLTLVCGTVIGSILFLSNLIFLLFSVPLVIIFNPQLYVGKMVPMIQYGFIIFVFVSFGFALILLKPDIIFRILRKLTSFRFVKPNHRLYGIIQKGKVKLEQFTNDYKDYIIIFIKERKGTFILGIFVAFALYFIRFLISYVIARALDSHVAFNEVAFVQVLMVFVGYFPTPGASGVSEFFSTLFMDSFMSKGTAVCFTPIWRFSTIYLESIAGGIVLFTQIKQDILQNAEPKANS